MASPVYNPWTHHEIQEAEEFLSNMNDEQFRKLDWKSKRAGQSAYDGEGRRLTHANWFPVFIQKEELQAKQTDLTDLRRSLRER